MKLTYFGSGGGEGIPALFCSCPVCQRAVRLGGKDLRTRLQALVDESLLLDFPPDSMMHRLAGGLDFSKTRAILFTHSHADHLHQADMESIKPEAFQGGFIDIYGNEAVIAKIMTVFQGKDMNRFCLRLHTIHRGDSFELMGYTVTALPAVHCPPEESVFYLIQKDGQSILYVHDSGPLTEEHFRLIAEKTDRLDLVSLDCTWGSCHDSRSVHHMDGLQNAELRREFLRRGLADESTRFVMAHMTHNSSWTHADMEVFGAANGLIPAWDGLCIDLDEK